MTGRPVSCRAGADETPELAGASARGQSHRLFDEGGKKLVQFEESMENAALLLQCLEEKGVRPMT